MHNICLGHNRCTDRLIVAAHVVPPGTCKARFWLSDGMQSCLLPAKAELKTWHLLENQAAADAEV